MARGYNQINVSDDLSRLLVCPLLIVLTALSACDGGAASTDDNPTTDAEALPAETDAALAYVPPAYMTDPPDDPRSAINAALEAGLFGAYDNPDDRVRATLRAAGVAEASQVLVFSKTSMQAQLISPRRPRAIYFNDNCYIGYVPGGLIEYGDVDADPQVGSGMFALDPRIGSGARMNWSIECSNCHSGSRTDFRPGFLVRSVFPDAKGFPITSAGSRVVGHDTPINKRWGGWYVTGTHGTMRHMGNQIAEEYEDGGVSLDVEAGANTTDLSPYIDTDLYPAATSDIVALMVLEHQVQMHNLISQGGSIVTEQVKRSQSVAKHLGETFDPAASDTLQRVIDSNAEKIVKHLLFCDEVALDSPVVGDPAYQACFRANRREDSAGRSLKDFDLRTRLFRYRCSYMVYSRAFTLMPELLKQPVLSKLAAVLTGENNDPAYAHLGGHERGTILMILRETGVLPG